MSPAFLLKRWERFWFEDVPSEAFSLVRIAIGAAGLVSLLGFTPVAMFWAPDGLAPIPPQSGIRALVLESGLGGTAGWAIFLTLLTGFACMTAGLFTGSSVMLCFIGSVIQTRWNSMPLSAAHSLLMATLFCLAWADCGTRLSVDDWRRRRRRDAHSDWTGAGARNDQTATQPIWPLRLIRAQIAVLYLTSGLYKLLGPSWRDGTAVYHSTHQNIYGRVLNVYPLSPGLDWVLTVLTYATVVWELSFPLLLLNRWTRIVGLATGVAIHLGVWATMEVGPFSLMILATYVAFRSPQGSPDCIAAGLVAARPDTGTNCPIGHDVGGVVSASQRHGTEANAGEVSQFCEIA